MGRHFNLYWGRRQVKSLGDNFFSAEGVTAVRAKKAVHYENISASLEGGGEGQFRSHTFYSQNHLKLVVRILTHEYYKNPIALDFWIFCHNNR